MYLEVTDFFDVWGNKKDGWEVNNQCHDYYKVRKMELTRKSVLRFLKRIDFIKKTVRIDSIKWEEMDSGYILNTREYCPVCIIEIAPDYITDKDCKNV